MLYIYSRIFELLGKECKIKAGLANDPELFVVIKLVGVTGIKLLLIWLILPVANTLSLLSLSNKSSKDPEIISTPNTSG